MTVIGKEIVISAAMVNIWKQPLTVCANGARPVLSRELLNSVESTLTAAP